ncbi:general secretion pathway protein GspH [Geomonas sp. RF6]|nr:general secretion pathway protein GspH [Geomonas sp. RF6]
MVVLAIIAFAAAIVVPRLPAPEGTRLKSSARNLATAIRFLNDQAIITKGVYRLTFNMAENSASIAKLSPSGEVLPPDDQLMNRKLIEEGISIEDVTDPKLGRVSEGEVTVTFGPRGNQECLTAHLRGGSEHYTVIAYPGGSKVQVQEGYQEVATGEERK